MNQDRLFKLLCRLEKIKDHSSHNYRNTVSEVEKEIKGFTYFTDNQIKGVMDNMIAWQRCHYGKRFPVVAGVVNGDMLKPLAWVAEIECLGLRFIYE